MPTLRTLSVLALALALAVVAAPRALAQQMPTKQQIEKELESAFAKIPEEKTETADVASLSYKPIPTDALTAVQDSGQQLPPGTNADQAAKQFGPMAKPYIEKVAGKLGTLTVKVALKAKSVTLAPGDYSFGLIMEEMNPVGITISGGALKAPLQLPLKAIAQPKEPYKHFKCELRAGKAEGDLVFWVGFGPVDAVSAKVSSKK